MQSIVSYVLRLYFPNSLPAPPNPQPEPNVDVAPDGERGEYNIVGILVVVILVLLAIFLFQRVF